MNNNRQKYYKVASKPLTSSTSGKKYLLKIEKKKKINSTDKIYRKINKNNSVGSRSNNSANLKKNNLNFTNYNNAPNLIKKLKNKKKRNYFKKKKIWRDNNR